MAKHMSIRLAWHGNGWNGRICNDPANNTYCVGRYSYPGDSIFEKRNLEWEQENSGTLCGICSNEIVPCCLSINAFGGEHIKGYIDVPKWMEGKAEGVSTDIPPYTAFTWGYESMYSDDVLASAEDGRKYNNNVRFANAKEYFDSFEANKSLLFYYANYSNPFSDDEVQKYVIVGISRLKQMGKYLYYENPTEEIKKNYANGIVWQK